MESLKKVMPYNIEKLIKQINHSDNREPITCVIADLTIDWTLEVASKMGLKQVAVCPAGPACLALSLHIPKLIKEGVIDENGSPIKNEVISLSEEVSVLNSSELLWSIPGKQTAHKFLFDISLTVKQAAEKASVVLCNTFEELDSSSCALIPNILPIGPLPLVKNLNWLDKQPSNSVIYIAFGSTTVFSQKQFNELALGLELSTEERLLNGHPKKRFLLIHQYLVSFLIVSFLLFLLLVSLLVTIHLNFSISNFFISRWYDLLHGFLKLNNIYRF